MPDVPRSGKMVGTTSNINKIKRGSEEPPTISLVINLTGMTVSPTIFGLAPSFVFAALLGLGPTGAS